MPMAPSGVTLNKPAAVTFLLLIAGGIVAYKYFWKPSAGPSTIKTGSVVSEKDISVVKLPDLPSVPVDQQIKVDKGDLTVTSGGKEFKIYHLKSEPAGAPKLTVLLLHGMAFNADTWLKTQTVQNLTSWGYRVVAIDLPGGAESSAKDVSLGTVSKADFLAAVVAAVEKDLKPVVVSPSMSGSFALPYLFQDPAKSLQKASGYVAVAPTSTSEFKSSYPHSQLPTLIVAGSKDRMGPSVRENLGLLPNSQSAIIPDAGHACYMEQPQLFHKALYFFLSKLSK